MTFLAHSSGPDEPGRPDDPAGPDLPGARPAEWAVDGRDRPAIRISGPGDLLDALPRMLGYLPRRSAVLVALRPPRGRLVMTMRIDLPTRRQEAACARELAGHAQRSGATSAVLVVYDDALPASGGGRWSGASLARALKTALRQRGGLRLDDALAVRDGRWRSLLCRDEGCCPDGGQPLRPPDEPSAIAVALAVGGARVLPDRAALVASIAAPTGERAEELEPVYERVAGELAAEVAAAAVGTDLLTGVRTFASLLSAINSRELGIAPDDETAVRLVLAMADVRLRDEVLALAAQADTDALLGLLTDCAVVALAPHDPPVLSALAWVAYARGDGTLANIAVDRALASDPDYSLAQLIASGLRAGLHPEHVRSVSAAVAEDLAAPEA